VVTNKVSIPLRLVTIPALLQENHPGNLVGRRDRLASWKSQVSLQEMNQQQKYKQGNEFF
jgi:hypothetical protein